jgi:hypothetical protein
MVDNDISFRQRAFIEFHVEGGFPLLINTTDFSAFMEMCAFALVVLDDG